MAARSSGFGRVVSRAATAARALWLVLLGASALMPLAALVVRSLAREWFFPALVPDSIDLEPWRGLFGARLGIATLTTLALAAAVGTIAALAGFPIGRALAELRGWRRALAAGCVFLPVAAPPIAIATGLHLTFLAAGLAGTWTGVLLAHLVPATGYASLFYLGILAAYDRRIEDEARALGARPSQVLQHVALPILRRPIAEAAALGFLVSWAQVPLTLVIGGGAVRTLPVEVLAYVQAGQDRFAATGALLLAAPALAMLAAVSLAARRTEAVPA